MNTATENWIDSQEEQEKMNAQYEAYLSTLSPIERYEREVADILINVLEITNGDAQGMVEAQGDILMECFKCETSVTECAKIIANH
jgi:hypothetical protein